MFNIEPFGYDPRRDQQAAMTPTILANAHRDPKKSQPFRISDFLQVRKLKKPQGWEQMKGLLKAMTKGR